MQLLFTADTKYAIRIPVVLKSIWINDPGIPVNVHLISDDLAPDLEERIMNYCKHLGYSFHLYQIPEKLFDNAPVNKHYSKAMYYRLLAAEILPLSVDRVIYIDPDILVINSLLPLWEMELEDHIFAAASHTVEEGLADNINRVRLETSAVYFNTGVILMDLLKCRKHVHKEDVFSYIINYDYKLLLPDQDVFNALYGSNTLHIPDSVWNYDARKYSQYLMRSAGLMDDRWVVNNTVILHFCGKEKPWNDHYRYRFGNLYRHYEHLCARDGWNGK